MSDNEIAVSDDNFKAEILDKEGVKLVDFWAGWCYPCKVLAPIIDELAQKYAGKITVGKLDVDANPKTSEQYNITGIPTVIIFKDGKILQQFVGVQPKEAYEKILDQLLKPQ